MGPYWHSNLQPGAARKEVSERNGSRAVPRPYRFASNRRGLMRGSESVVVSDPRPAQARTPNQPTKGKILCLTNKLDDGQALPLPLSFWCCALYCYGAPRLRWPRTPCLLPLPPRRQVGPQCPTHLSPHLRRAAATVLPTPRPLWAGRCLPCPPSVQEGTGEGELPPFCHGTTFRLTPGPARCRASSRSTPALPSTWPTR